MIDGVGCESPYHLLLCGSCGHPLTEHLGGLSKGGPWTCTCGCVWFERGSTVPQCVRSGIPCRQARERIAAIRSTLGGQE